VPYDNSLSELVYQGRLFKKQLSCRKFFREAIANHCKRILRNGESCLLVEEEESLALWRTGESLAVGQISQSNTQTNTQTNGQPFGQNTRTSRSEATKSQGVSAAIEPAFLERCQQIMTDYIDAMAPQSIQEILQQSPHLTHRQLVDQLAALIPDPEQAEEFWQRVLTRSDSPEPQQTAQNGYADPAARSPGEPSSPSNPNEPPKPPFKRVYRGISY
jgi:hypothetical protein